VFNVRDIARVHCSGETRRARCTDNLEVAIETAVGLTFHGVAWVICRPGAARILVAI
jgi:hypothetical protein